jgi:NADH:ubiquinone oxidoreductase subunit F (NADH-binding)
VLLAPGTLLLAGVTPGEGHGLARHRRIWGDQPPATLDALVGAAARESIVGAGGAAFPTGRKLASLADRPVSHVVVNGSEGESASGKDGVLLQHVPHLVLDGAVVAARALRAPRVVVRISEDRPDLVAQLPGVFAERRQDGVRFELSVGPATFAAGEATAVVRALAGGPAAPADLGRPPLLPGRLQLRRPAVLVSNVETFARLAVASRGLRADSALASASGAVARPGVAELPATATLGELANVAGGTVGDPVALITGGWHGRWVAWPAASGAGLTRDGVAAVGGRWGAGAFVWIPSDLPLDAALGAVAGELAAGTAGQCGPCWRGLPEVARTAVAVARGQAAAADLEALLGEVDGRGICAHPGAAAQAIRSAVELIGQRS